MKKFAITMTIVIAFMMFCHPVHADTCTRIIKCEICGQEIIERYECDNTWGYLTDDSAIFSIGGYVSTRSNKLPGAEEIYFKKSIDVCPRCDRKHAGSFHEALDAAWVSTLDQAMESESARRIENTGKAKERKLDSLQKEVEKLQEEIKKLR